MPSSCTVTGPKARPMGTVIAKTGAPTLPAPVSGAGCAGVPGWGRENSRTSPRLEE